MARDNVLHFPGGALDLTGLPEKNSGVSTFATPEEIAAIDAESDELEAQLRASLAELEERDTEPPETQPADAVEQAAFQEARAVIRRARTKGRLGRRVRPTRDQWPGLSDYHRARLVLEQLDEQIANDPDDPTLPWLRLKFIDGVGELVRTMLRNVGVIA